MREINFCCQNVNIFLDSKELVKVFDDFLQATNPSTMMPTVPNLSIQPPMIPAVPNQNTQQPITPTVPNQNTQPPMIPSTTCPNTQPTMNPSIPNQNTQPPMIPSSPNPATPYTNGSGSSTALAQVEGEIFSLVNSERIKNGLSPLTQNAALANVARRKSQNMGDKGYFGHTAPDGTTTADWLKNEGHFFTAWGENIADFGANATAAEIMNGWMNSPGHRANILKPDFTLLGVGIYVINNRTLATQVFGR